MDQVYVWRGEVHYHVVIASSIEEARQKLRDLRAPGYLSAAPPVTIFPTNQIGQIPMR